MLVNNSWLGFGEKDTTRSPSQYISKVLLVSSQPEVFNFRVNNEKCIGASFLFSLFHVLIFTFKSSDFQRGFKPVLPQLLIGASIPDMLQVSLLATMPVLSLNLHQNLFSTGETNPGRLLYVWSACISPTAAIPFVDLSVRMPLPVGVQGRGCASANANANASFGWCLQRELLYARAWFTICFSFSARCFVSLLNVIILQGQIFSDNVVRSSAII